MVRTEGEYAKRRENHYSPGILLRSTVIVLDAHDVILAEVISALNLDEYKKRCPRIFDTMRGTCGNIYSAAGFQGGSHDRSGPPYGVAGNSHPVLRSAKMFLVAQAGSRKNLDAFYLIGWAFIENCVRAPWTMDDFGHS